MAQVNKETGKERAHKNQALAWWYVNGTYDYRELLQMDQVHLTAVKQNGDLINEDVNIKVIGGTAHAITADGDKHVLLPNHWVTPRSNHLENFWLTKDEDAQDIVGVEEVTHGGPVNQPDMRLFGHGHGSAGTIFRRDITSIVPIDGGKYIATGVDGVPYVVSREETPARAKVTMQRLG